MLRRPALVRVVCVLVLVGLVGVTRRVLAAPRVTAVVDGDLRAGAIDGRGGRGGGAERERGGNDGGGNDPLHRKSSCRATCVRGCPAAPSQRYSGFRRRKSFSLRKLCRSASHCRPPSGGRS